MLDINVNVSLSVESRECIDRLVTAMNGAYARFDLVHELTGSDTTPPSDPPAEQLAEPSEPVSETDGTSADVKAKPKSVDLDQLRTLVKQSSLNSKQIVELLKSKYKVEKVSDLNDDQIADFVIDLGVSVEA